MANYSLTTAQGNSINRSDVAVIDIEITDAYAIDNGPGSAYETDAKAKVLVKNLGPNTVDSVRLNHFVSIFTFCGHIVKSEYYGGLNLAAGDSMWIDFGWLGLQINQSQGDSLKREICIYSSNPNGFVDLNVPNDQFCTDHFFGFLDVDENEKLDFEIFPNPASDFVQINALNGFNGMITISDNSGRLVLSESLSSKEINLSNLNSGVYFVTLINNEGNSSIPKKLVKK